MLQTDSAFNVCTEEKHQEAGEIYEGLDLHPDVHEHLYSSVFPLITMFLGSSPMDVVIKFVECYGEEAYQLLAKEHLVPQLLYCGRVGINNNDPIFGELQMVIMEYVDGETLQEVKQVPPRAKEEVICALEILHDKNYVFGDLRWQNIMIMRNEEVKLVDFDWTGKENEI